MVSAGLHMPSVSERSTPRWITPGARCSQVSLVTPGSVTDGTSAQALFLEKDSERFTESSCGCLSLLLGAVDNSWEKEGCMQPYLLASKPPQRTLRVMPS